MPTWFYWFLAALILATVGILLLANLWQRQRRRQRIGVELSNTGNVPVAYEMHAESPDRALAFSFWLDGRPLAEQEVLPEPRQASVVAAGPAPRPAAGSNGGFSLKQEILSGLGTVVGMLSTLAMLLSPELGAPLKKAAAGLRGVQTQGMRAAQLQSQAASLGARAQSVGRPAQNPAASWPGPVGAPAGPATPRQAWAQTPEIQPGQALLLDLYVQATGGGHAKQVLLSVLSRPAGQSVEPLAETATLQLPFTSWIGRYGPYLLVLAAALVALAGAWRLATLPLLGG